MQIFTLFLLLVSIRLFKILPCIQVELQKSIIETPIVVVYLFQVHKACIIIQEIAGNGGAMMIGRLIILRNVRGWKHP